MLSKGFHPARTAAARSGKSPAPFSVALFVANNPAQRILSLRFSIF